MPSVVGGRPGDCFAWCSHLCCHAGVSWKAGDVGISSVLHLWSRARYDGRSRGMSRENPRYLFSEYHIVSLTPSDTSLLPNSDRKKPYERCRSSTHAQQERCVCCVGYAGKRQTDVTDRSACEGRCDLSVSLGWILGWCVPSTSGRRWLYSVSLQVSRIEVARRIEMSDLTCQVWRCGCTGVCCGR